ncbi:hypothetical protein [Demequina aestuarii]|uniref:hypothetical protein n=1 Tax=Demequina aestuarii TaxID=327095 RepID=UPI00078511AA|nr:hypothetical protein [Demequina aestuarii]
MELKAILDRIADIILERGTGAVRNELDVLARSAEADHPGAAAALTDWHGAEIARERAFAILRREAAYADAVHRHELASSLLALHGVALAV